MTSPCTFAAQDSQIVFGDGFPQSMHTLFFFFFCTAPPSPYEFLKDARF